MKMQYPFLLAAVWGMMGSSSGIDDTPKNPDFQKPTGRAWLMSSRISQDADDNEDLHSTPAVPPVPSTKSSSPRDIPSSKATSPKGRVLKQRYVHPSGNYSSASPKQNIPNSNSSSPTPAPTDNQKPLSS